jgi:signal transduction histidine kinase/HPt (histidine-containing phosphotransfer) domain-containing protein/ActR/RegA family two-component response regulator
VTAGPAGPRGGALAASTLLAWAGCALLTALAAGPQSRLVLVPAFPITAALAAGPAAGLLTGLLCGLSAPAWGTLLVGLEAAAVGLMARRRVAPALTVLVFWVVVGGPTLAVSSPGDEEALATLAILHLAGGLLGAVLAPLLLGLGVPLPATPHAPVPLRGQLVRSVVTLVVLCGLGTSLVQIAALPPAEAGRQAAVALLAIAVAALLAAGLATHTARGVTDPIEALSAHVARFSLSGRTERLQPEGPVPAEVRELVEGFERLRQRLDDTWRQLRLSMAERERLDGELQSVLSDLEGTVRERTAEAEAARARAEEASRAKSQFLARMSHEIRTPMNAVVGMTGVLLDSGLRPDQHEYASTVRRAAESLLAIVNDILDFSRIEAGRLELEHNPFDPGQVAEQALELVLEAARAKGLEASLQLEGELPEAVVGDAGRLWQVLVNLLGNAVKFTPAGQVTLRVAPAGPGWLRFEVVDTGIGIAPEALSRVFESFMQADASTTRRFGGTGLGLAISRGLVGEMGGELRVDSAPGRGSRFHFEIPLPSVPGAAAPRSTGRLAPVRPAAGARILVAEDNPVNQRVAVLLLERMGHRVDVAGDGQEAVRAVQSLTYDLVLMDCHMPELDGYQAARQIRAGEAPGHHLPIVALTASVLPEDRARCREAGMDGFLAKPVTPETLERAVAEALAGVAGELVVSRPVGEAPLLDPERLGLLRSLGLAGEVMSALRAEVPADLAALRGALAEGHPAEAARRAHRLRGSAGNAGARRLEEDAARVEELARAGRHAELAQVVDELAGTWDGTLAELDGGGPSPADRSGYNPQQPREEP